MPVSKNKPDSPPEPSAEEAAAKESNPLVPKDKEEQPKKRIDAPKILHKESVSDSGIKFHIVAPDGSEAEIEADNVEDAIRAFNGRGDRRGKVFTFKQLKITER